MRSVAPRLRHGSDPEGGWRERSRRNSGRRAGIKVEKGELPSEDESNRVTDLCIIRDLITGISKILTQFTTRLYWTGFKRKKDVLMFSINFISNGKYKRLFNSKMKLNVTIYPHYRDI